MRMGLLKACLSRLSGVDRWVKEIEVLEQGLLQWALCRIRLLGFLAVLYLGDISHNHWKPAEVNLINVTEIRANHQQHLSAGPVGSPHAELAGV